MYNINYTFYNRYNIDYDVINRPHGSGDYLFLHFITPMKLQLNGQTIVTKENAFIIFDKGTPQLYSAVKTFQNSFIHFDTDQPFSEKYNIPTDTVMYFSNPEAFAAILNNIHLEFFTKKVFCEESLDCYMTQLMILLSRYYNDAPAEKNFGSYLFNVFQNARSEIMKDLSNDWTSESMAALTNLGVSQFYQYYRSFFGNTPKADLIDARISHAKELLINEKITVSEAALRSGFQTPSHFARYFKEKCHMTPLEWVHETEKAGLNSSLF